MVEMSTATSPSNPLLLPRLANTDCPGPGWVGERLSDTVAGATIPGAGAFKSDDLRFVKRSAIVLSASGQQLKVTDGLGGFTIHADGLLYPAVSLDGEACFVRLQSWADYGRENTRYERLCDGTTRFSKEVCPSG